MEIDPGLVLAETNFTELGERRQGKVRDIYQHDNQIIFVNTDRYSAFDRNLALIPYKGVVVNLLNQYWQRAIGTKVNNAATGFPDPNVMVAKPCVVIPVEVIVRGYITGVTNTSLWTLYEAGQRDFIDFELKPGLKKNQKLGQALITPTSKDEHDRPLTQNDIIDKIVDENTWRRMSATAFKLYGFAHQLANVRGLILADAKFEFGFDEVGRLMLVDEIFTPDSSRFWEIDNYHQAMAANIEPENYDKEYLRLWFKRHSDPYNDEVLPVPPTDVIREMSRRNIRVYEQLTGINFDKQKYKPDIERIKRNLALAA
ncbi:MAG: phosphoribosylaminoimidazolesuccinocarboxamide synthase [Candidatus Saccharimonadales bacterium]